MEETTIYFDPSKLYYLFYAIPVAALAWFIWKKKDSFNFSSGGTSVLDSFSRDITDEMRKGKMDPVIGREKEINQLAVIMGRRTKNNVILVGESGVGKTAIVEGLAQRIVNKTVPEDLQNKRVLALDLNALMAGTKYRGEFESRMKKMIDEIGYAGRDILLFIDEIHNLMVMESSGENLSIGDILKPAMARGELQIIGATTPMEFKKYFANDPAFERRLQPIIVKAPNNEETLAVLKGIKGKYETYHKVQIPEEILGYCVEKASQVLPDRSFPDKAIDIMDETASNIKIKHAGEDLKNPASWPTMTREEIDTIISGYTVIA